MKIVLALLALLLVFTSCQKEDKKNNTESTVVRYTIQPIDENIMDVRYQKGNGDFVIEADSVQFADGSHQFNVSSFPFAAKVGLRFQDNVFSVEEYEVAIYVNGTLKARDTISNTTPSSVGEGYVEYTVE
jgi:hypothetical protein